MDKAWHGARGADSPAGGVVLRHPASPLHALISYSMACSRTIRHIGHRMPTSASSPTLHSDPGDPGRLRLQGRWTLRHTELIGQALEQAPDKVAAIDASGVERLDTLGVLRLIRF